MSTKIGIGVFIVLVIILGFLYSKDRAVAPAVSDNPVVTDGPVNLGEGEAEFVDKFGNISTSSVSIEKPASLPQPIPSLTRAFVVPALYASDPATKKLMEEKNAAAIANLKVNPGDSTGWTSLGVIRKVSEDYVGAKEAWEYSARLNPKDSVVHFNLADLYMTFLKEYSKAEIEWKKVLVYDNTNTLAYRGLFELYHLYYSAKADQAPGVLLAGLTVSPADVDLMIPLAQYYKEKKDTASARVYFQKALDIARQRNNTQLIKLLEEELKNL